MNYFKVLANIPAFIGLYNAVTTLLKNRTEANANTVIDDIVPLVEAFDPSLSEAEVLAFANDLKALVTLGSDHSAGHCAAVAGVIVESLPAMGLPLTEEHATNLVTALTDAFGDFGLGKGNA